MFRKESHKEDCAKTKTISRFCEKRPKTSGIEHDANYIRLPLSRWVSVRNGDGVRERIAKEKRGQNLSLEEADRPVREPEN